MGSGTRPLSRQPTRSRSTVGGRFVQGSVLVVGAVVVDRLVVGLSSGDRQVLLVNVLVLLAATSAVVCPVLRARRRAPGRTRQHLRLMAAAAACWSLGQLYWAVAEVLLHRAQPFPSLADLGYLLFFPPIVAALVVAPCGREHRYSRQRRFLDAAAVVFALLLILWSTVLANVLDAVSSGDWLESTVSFAYPTGDVAAAGMAAMLFLAVRPAWRPVLVAYSAAFGLLLAADGGFAYLVANDSYATGSWVDGGWVAGFALLAWAPSLVPDDETDTDERVAVASRWGTALPVLAFSLGLLMALLDTLNGAFKDHPQLALLMTGVYVVAALRSMAARAEGVAYAHELVSTELALGEAQRVQEIALDAAQMVTLSWTAQTDTWCLGEDAGERLGLALPKTPFSNEAFLASIAPGDRATVTAAVAAVRPDRPGFDVELALPTRGGLRHLRARGEAQFSAEGRLEELVGVIFDVTETRGIRLLEERRQANAKALAELGARLPNCSSLDDALEDAVITLAALADASACEVWHGEDLRANWPRNPRRSAAVVSGSVNGARRDFEIRVRGLRWGTLLVRGRNDVDLSPESASLASAVASLISATVERITAQESLWHSARHDSLTGLPNRLLLHERLDSALRSGSRFVALAYLDLDGFKNVNDRFGHPVGDTLLNVVASRLRSCLRPDDLVARLGGDEFAVVMTELEGGAQAFEVVARILEALEVPAELGPVRVVPVASVGVATSAESGRDAVELLRNADLAMYVAKRSGGNRAVLFEPSFHHEAIAEGDRADELRGCLERGELVVHFQPVVDLATGGLCGAEALLRWLRPGHGLQFPPTFLPTLGRLGMLGSVTSFVLEQACAFAREYVDLHLSEPFVMAVNVTPDDVVSPEFADVVTLALAAAGLDPARLSLEIVESGVLADLPAAAQGLKALRARGVQVAIDDFGTGYSSMTQLKTLPVDIVKIDRNFVAGLGTELESSALVAALVTMAHTLGFDVIAEGVETEKQREALVSLGCEMAQGYLFGRAAPAHEFGLVQSIEPAAVPAPRAPSVAAPRRVWTVVVADDLEDDRRILTRFLTRSGRFAIVGEAADGATAVSMVSDLQPDVALLDVSMPQLDGFEALARIRAAAPSTAVVMLSGYVSDTTVRAALEGGARGCLAKGPVDITEELATLLEGQGARRGVP